MSNVSDNHKVINTQLEISSTLLMFSFNSANVY